MFLTAELTKVKDNIRIETLIGATNINTGYLDYFNYETYTDITDLVDILMSTSAIPGLFPANRYNGNIYVDGGELTNEIVAGLSGFCPEESFIHVDYIKSSRNATDIEFTNNLDILIREIDLMKSSFDDEITELVDVCKSSPTKIGMLHV